MLALLSGSLARLIRSLPVHSTLFPLSYFTKSGVCHDSETDLLVI